MGRALEIESAEIIVWQGRDGWYWELTLNGEAIGYGVPTNQTDCEHIARWLHSDLRLEAPRPDGTIKKIPIDYHLATDEENEALRAEQKRREQDKEDAKYKDLGLVQRPSRGKPKDLDELLHDYPDP